MNFETLKQSSSNFDALTKALEEKLNLKIKVTIKVNIKTIDLKPELDKSGNGYAVLRFLPASEGEDMQKQDYGHTHFKDLVDVYRKLSYNSKSERSSF